MKPLTAGEAAACSGRSRRLQAIGAATPPTSRRSSSASRSRRRSGAACRRSTSTRARAMTARPPRSRGDGARMLVATRRRLFAQELYVKLRRAGVEGLAGAGGRDPDRRQESARHRRRAADLAARARRWRSMREREMSRNSSPVRPRLLAPETSRRRGFSARRATGDGARTSRMPRRSLRSPKRRRARSSSISASRSACSTGPEKLSRLIIADDEPIDAAAPYAIAGDALRLVEPDDESDLARLTDSFHLNLTAFSLLAFIVGFFIVHASFGLAFEQRLPTVRTLRALGVSAGTLIAAMLCELALVTLIAGGGGVIGGYLIARALLPDVAASLEGLYGAQISESLDARRALVARRASPWRAAARFCAAASGLIEDAALAGPFRRAADRLARGASSLPAQAGGARRAGAHRRRRRLPHGRRACRRLRRHRPRAACRGASAAACAGRRPDSSAKPWRDARSRIGSSPTAGRRFPVSRSR